MIRRPSPSCFVGLLFFVLAVRATAAAPPKVGDAAKDATLKTPAGESIRLAGLWEKGPVVLVVLRGWPGYQCPICTKQVGELVGKSDDLASSKAQVVLIYPGPSDGLKAHAEEFALGKALPDNFHLVLDPDYAFTKAYDLRWDAPRETAYPSTFVIDAGGKVAFAKVSRSHGGRAKTADVLQALDRSKK